MVIFCLAGLFALLLLNEFLWRRKILKGESKKELKRKFTHILAACFISTWPWLITWEQIQLLGVAMVVVLLLNRQLKVLHYLGGVREKTYGDVFLALAVIVVALLTEEKIFFAVAILQVALADGLAAVVGSKYGKKWQYKVFGQTKSVIGSMTFWVTSLCVLGAGLLPAYDLMTFSQYTTLLIVLPPILAAAENLSPFGLDNLTVPLITVWVLQLTVV